MTSDSSSKDLTPRQLGYRWPAEWEPHAGTWIAWPHNEQTWPGEFTHIPAVFQQLIATLLQWEPVHLLASEPVIARQARDQLQPLITSTPHQLHWHDVATNDAWIRDFGPTFLVKNGSDGSASQLAGIDWPYNAWGGKYPPFELDQQATGKILSELDAEQFLPAMVLEGGAIEGNGAGTVIITESCLLNPNRNPGWTRSMAEQVLLDHLSADQFIWLNGKGLVGDDTEQQPAAWVDLFMPVNDAKADGGITILDHPDNPGHPAHWRVDGQHGINPAPCIPGSIELAASESMRYRYRLILRHAPLAPEQIQDHWDSYQSEVH